jgi:hypothetical protein
MRITSHSRALALAAGSALSSSQLESGDETDLYRVRRPSEVLNLGNHINLRFANSSTIFCYNGNPPSLASGITGGLRQPSFIGAILRDRGILAVRATNPRIFFRCESECSNRPQANQAN